MTLLTATQHHTPVACTSVGATCQLRHAPDERAPHGLRGARVARRYAPRERSANGRTSRRFVLYRLLGPSVRDETGANGEELSFGGYPPNPLRVSHTNSNEAGMVKKCAIKKGVPRSHERRMIMNNL